MGLARYLCIAALPFAAAIGFATVSFAAIDSVYFSAGTTCAGANTASFSTGGPAVPVTLCMNTSGTTKTCGFTAALKSTATPGSGFVLTALGLGPNYPDSTWDPLARPVPLPINSSTPVIDLGGLSTGQVPATSNQVLATFSLTPEVGATNPSYAITLDSASMIAVDPDTACVPQSNSLLTPLEVFINTLPVPPVFTLNRSAAPVFTSPSSATFSSTASNTFTVTATGNPLPTITASGLPSGVAFIGPANTGVGTLSAGPITSGGTITFVAGSATQIFTLNVASLASQTINFPLLNARAFSSTPFAISATASSGLPVVFNSQTPSTCSVFAGNVTMLALGNCTILASQDGIPGYQQVQATQNFSIIGTPPGAPASVAAASGNGQAVVSFSAPASTGGSPITSYTATCSPLPPATGVAVLDTGTTSPITVSPMVNGTTYACAVTASNVYGQGPSASSAANVTPNVGALTLISVKSRKVHGLGTSTNPFVTFDLPLDTAPLINGLVTSEPRNEFNPANAGGNGHVIVFKFNNPITSAGTVTTSAINRSGAPIPPPGAVATFLPGSDEVVVALSAVVDISRVAISLANVNTTGPTAAVAVGFLVADMSNNRAVNSGDIVGAFVRSGRPVDQTNFRFDFNLNGLINSGDYLGAAVRSGNGLQ